MMWPALSKRSGRASVTFRSARGCVYPLWLDWRAHEEQGGALTKQKTHHRYGAYLERTVLSLLPPDVAQCSDRSHPPLRPVLLPRKFRSRMPRTLPLSLVTAALAVYQQLGISRSRTTTNEAIVISDAASSVRAYRLSSACGPAIGWSASLAAAPTLSGR